MVLFNSLAFSKYSYICKLNLFSVFSYFTMINHIGYSLMVWEPVYIDNMIVFMSVDMCVHIL